MSGPDAFSFLQGQTTNDLRDATAVGIYTLWLEQKGQVLADGFVLGTAPDEFWLASYFSPAETLRSRLDAYIIADDVTVEDHTGEVFGVTTFGERSGDPAWAARVQARHFPGRRGAASEEWIVAKAYEAETREHFADVRSLSHGDIDSARILAAVPAIPADVGPKDLPQEGGLEAIAISYTKGCYLGQEVMARLKSMGQVRRQLRRVTGQGVAPAAPCALYQGERRVAELRSTAPRGDAWVGLAMVWLLQAQPDQPLSVDPAAAATVYWHKSDAHAD